MNSGDRCDNAREVSPVFLKLAAIFSSTAFGNDVGPGLKLMSFTDGLGELSDPTRAGWVFAFIFLFRIVFVGNKGSTLLFFGIIKMVNHFQVLLIALAPMLVVELVDHHEVGVMETVH